MMLAEWDLIKQGYVKTEDGSYYLSSGRTLIACILYNNGQLWCRHYRVNGFLSRNPVEGPAIEYFNRDGSIYYQEYYVDGRFMSSETC